MMRLGEDGNFSMSSEAGSEGGRGLVAIERLLYILMLGGAMLSVRVELLAES